MSENFKSLHHTFDVQLAAEYGLEEAVLIHHFQHWIQHNKILNRNFYEGRTWMYQTLDEISAHFPYLSRKQVERIINRLVKKDVIIKNNFNKHKMDRTVWYAFKNEEIFIISPNREMVSRNREIVIPKSGNCDPEIGTPIPNTITNTETNSVCFGDGPVGQEKNECFKNKIFYETTNKQHLAIEISELKSHLSQFPQKAIELTILDLHNYNKPINDIRSLSTVICQKKSNQMKKVSKHYETTNKRSNYKRNFNEQSTSEQPKKKPFNPNGKSVLDALIENNIPLRPIKTS